MENIHWEERFSVGVPSMDGEHQRIIRMINTLQAGFASANNVDSVSELLAQMTRYAQEHFQHEEQLLRASNYPHLLEQQAQHAGYRKKNGALCQASVLDIAGMPQVILNFLSHWWTHHILEEDMRYKDHLAGMAKNEKM